LDAIPRTTVSDRPSQWINPQKLVAERRSPTACGAGLQPAADFQSACPVNPTTFVLTALIHKLIPER
jgi:hypothetical protein